MYKEFTQFDVSELLVKDLNINYTRTEGNILKLEEVDR